jgi:hypothetical protein
MSIFALGLLVAVIGLGVAIVMRRHRTHAITSCAVAVAGLLVALGAAVAAGPTGRPLPGLALSRMVEDMLVAGWRIICTSRECLGRWERLGVRYDITIRRVGRDSVGKVIVAAHTDRPVARNEVLQPLEYPVILVARRAGAPSIQRLRRLLRAGETPASWQTQYARFTLEGGSCNVQQPLDCRLTVEPAR